MPSAFALRLPKGIAPEGIAPSRRSLLAMFCGRDQPAAVCTPYNGCRGPHKFVFSYLARVGPADEA